MLKHSVPVSILPLTRRLPASPPHTTPNSLDQRLNDLRSTFISWLHTKTQNQHEVTLRKCYNLLGVSEDCTHEELREAYIHLAKHYHPDSGSHAANTDRFSQVEEAYKTIKVVFQVRIDFSRQYITDY